MRKINSRKGTSDAARPHPPPPKKALVGDFNSMTHNMEEAYNQQPIKRETGAGLLRMNVDEIKFSDLEFKNTKSTRSPNPIHSRRRRRKSMALDI